MLRSSHAASVKLHGLLSHFLHELLLAALELGDDGVLVGEVWGASSKNQSRKERK